MESELNLEVKGMHCNSCAKLINEKLSKMDGVISAEASFADEKVKVSFNSEKTGRKAIEAKLAEIGYPAKGSKKTGSTLKQGIIYGLTPHIGCIGFLAASILGVTVAVEFFRPLLMNPWFFHILVAISFLFATVSSAFYLNKNGILSLAGIKRKKKYLTAMYGSTIAINLLLFLVIFPLTANFDTGSFAETPTGAVALAGTGSADLGEAALALSTGDSLLKLQVDIPCPGHAPLISGELKKVPGVTGVKYEFPNYFSVAFTSTLTSKEEILAPEVFRVYKPTLLEEITVTAADESAQLEGIEELEEIQEVASYSSAADSAPAGSCGGTCGGSCGGCGCGG